MPLILLGGGFPTSSTGYIGAINTVWDTVFLYKTTDGGLNWNIIMVQPGTSLNLYFIDAITGFYSNEYGQLFRTTNGGANWNSVFSTSGMDLIERIYFQSPMIGYGTAGNSKFLKSTDAGITWSETTLPYVGEFYGLDCTDTNTCYIVGGNGFSTGTLIKTTDGGANWIETPTTCDLLWDVDFVNDTVGYTCGLSGTILKYGSSGLSLQELPIEKFSIYPNPAKEFIMLSFDNPHNENFKAIIYNSQGGIIKEINNINTNAIQIDLTGIAAGLYNIQLYSGHPKFMGRKFIVE